jgi:hypothetical protein
MSGDLTQRTARHRGCRRRGDGCGVSGVDEGVSRHTTRTPGGQRRTYVRSLVLHVFSLKDSVRCDATSMVHLADVAG